MKLRRTFAALALAAAFAGAAIVAAQPGARDRQRTVAGWLVEDAAEEDGGRLVRMTRTSGPYRLEYHAAFWHGNDGVIQHVSAIGAGCGGSGALDRHLILHVSEIRARLAAGLAECAAPRRAAPSAPRCAASSPLIFSLWPGAGTPPPRPPPKPRRSPITAPPAIAARPIPAARPRAMRRKISPGGTTPGPASRNLAAWATACPPAKELASGHDCGKPAAR